MHYRYHHFHLPIARYFNRLSPVAKTVVGIAQFLLLTTLLAFELSNNMGIL